MQNRGAKSAAPYRQIPAKTNTVGARSTRSNTVRDFENGLGEADANRRVKTVWVTLIFTPNSKRLPFDEIP
jgi:hypothetical protein